ncbi:solute carrier family 25 member 38 [Thozetella sp. PMI_491]|nr:solute carrier family 25 member 38 [Thozetella sp. PMI_491]
MSDGRRQGQQKSKSTFHFVAGLGSGVSSALLLQPFDLLKTRVQQQRHGSHPFRAAVAELRNAPNLVTALWRGAVPSALRTGFGSAIYFTSLNAIRQNAARMPVLGAAPSLPVLPSQLPAATAVGGKAGDELASIPPAAAAVSRPKGQRHSSSLVKLSNTGNLLTGAVARAFAGFILMPMTVIKVRYESSMYHYRSIADAARGIVAQEGFKGFFAGFGATAIRDAPYAGLYVVFYEQSKKRLSALYGGPSDDASAAGTGPMGVSRAASINFMSGVVGSTIATALTNPFDAVKTRIQLQPDQYRNMVHALRRMVGEEGFRALWDGLALRMSRKALSSALAWTVYEELIRRAETTWSNAAAREVL